MPNYNSFQFYRIDIPYGPGWSLEAPPSELLAIKAILGDLTDAVYPPDDGIREVHCYVPRNHANEAVRRLKDAGYDAD
jgi:hypothetical protein